MSPRITPLVVALACLALAGCDQFARVGIAEREREVVPPPPGEDAGDAAEPDATATDDAATQPMDAAAECAPVEIAICNPVINEGCSAAVGMQCAVDLAATLAGYCIFSSPEPPALNGACLNTGVTESCPPTSACVAERCRKLCLCDADCTAGQCCSESIGTTGFSACDDC